MSVDSLGNWRRTHYSNMIGPSLDGEKVTVFGWVEDVRDLGGITFITLRDREGLLQITVLRKKISEKILEKISKIGRQFAIGVKGTVKSHKEAPREVEVIPEDVKILATATHPLPLDPTGRVPADIDVRLNARVLDLRRPECRAIFKIRHEALKEIRRFFIENGFMEVHTPKIIAAAAEGGAALFPVDYFEQKAFLAQSPELYKEQLTTVFEKVFEVGTYFRAEESHTRRHLNEFISVDIEEAFATVDDVMNVQEELTRSIVSHVVKACQNELDILGVSLKTPSQPFKRYTYSEIIEELRKRNVEVEWGEDIPTPAYRELGELHKQEYYFIVDWPSRVRPFYIKPREDRPELCYAFDFMYEWIEITSGGSRVDSKDVFISRLKEQNLDPRSFDFYLTIFDYGMPPHAGFGMGLERTLMALVGKENIREVVLFPRDRFRLTP
jgi:aspartyl-tRNA synthetase